MLDETFDRTIGILEKALDEVTIGNPSVAEFYIEEAIAILKTLRGEV